MRRFSKKDLFYSVVTGLYSGAIAWQIFEFLQIDIFDKLLGGYVVYPDMVGVNKLHISSAWMMLIIPLVWIIGVNFGYFLGRWMPFFNQFGRFAVIGFTNFIITAGVLNLFIAFSGISIGVWYSIFVAISFIIGVVHSYYWNKVWVFESGTHNGGGTEFTKFISVAVVAGLVNVVVASVLVNFIHPLFGISSEGWANIGNIAGSAAGLVFSFVGFRIVVFKKV